MLTPSEIHVEKKPAIGGLPMVLGTTMDEGWLEGRRGDGAVFNVNRKGTVTESWWQSPQGGKYGHLETEDWAPEV